MSHSQSVFRKYISPQMITSSFTGMIMALPLVFALNSSASRVNNYQAQPAVQNQSTAQVTQADFAKYMYAYDQGYQAHTASVPTGTTTMPGTCTNPSSGSGSSDTPSAPVAMTTSYKMPHAPAAQVVNSYNSYVSTVNNSSTVTNTNSNNTAGSNNVTKTTISAKELKGVTVDNSSMTTQVAAVDSFKTNSNNTKTDTTTISDSFNKQIAIDSGNNSGNTTTSTDTTNVTNNMTNNVTKTIDSNNTTNVTKDSNNSSTSSDTTTNTTTNTTDVTNNVNKTIDSNNTSVDVSLGNGNQGDSHSHSA